MYCKCGSKDLLPGCAAASNTEAEQQRRVTRTEHGSGGKGGPRNKRSWSAMLWRSALPSHEELASGPAQPLALGPRLDSTLASLTSAGKQHYERNPSAQP